MSGDFRHAALAPLVAAAAAGRADAVASATRAALAAGCTADEIREALLTMAPFCGFPRTLDAVAVVRPLLGDAAPQAASPRASWPARGAAFFDRVYGKDAVRVRANLRALDVEVAAWIEDDAYGKILSRPGMSASLRERIAVVLLAAQGLRNQLPGHVKGALNCGATVDEIAAFLDAASPYLAPAEVAAAREALARAAARSEGSGSS